MTKGFTLAVTIVVLGIIYAVLQVGCVRPHLWPAGHGAFVDGDPRFTGGAAVQPLLLGRPPMIDDAVGRATTVIAVVPEAPADLAGIRESDVITEQRDLRTNGRVDLREFPSASTPDRLRAWRESYRMGARDPLRLVVYRAWASRELRVDVQRPAVWRLDRESVKAWAQEHIASLLQIVGFIGVSVVLLALRASDPLAVLAVVALTLCAVATGGPPLGGEYLLPSPLQELVTLFSWVATPLAFVATTFAILYFPRRAALLARHPWLHVLPFAVTSPMLVLTACSALFLLGVDAVLPVVAWDATHAWLYFASFALSVVMIVACMMEGLLRFQSNPDQNERRRIQIAVVTIVPGVLAFAVKDGVPGIGLLLGREWILPWWQNLALEIVVLLPAFGLTYAVAVHRVFSPAAVIRQSVQYALARKTLALLAMLPAIALVASLVKNRDMSIRMLVSGQPLLDLVMIGGLAAAIRYRDRARLWLDRRFFREAYDAREILLSLASRITFETDPNDLTAMVVDRIDSALHPESIAVLVGGMEEGKLKPISVLRGTAAPLDAAGGLVTMLRWSKEPLELYVNDERSPATRLPPGDQEWLTTTGAVLLVPVIAHGSDRDARQSELIALIALGIRRSEEPYTAEDRQLLGSIASQIGLALDVARLRQRALLTDAATNVTTMGAGADVSAHGLTECPQCGRCEAAGVVTCPDDGMALIVVSTVPHVIEKKYRIDRVLGRGGMGAVYRARDVRLDRNVAIKVVRAGLLDDTETRARFRREAQIVARLQHPGIVSVFDYGTFADGSAFIVMELVRGEDLRAVLRREKTMPADRALQLLTATSMAVQAAHREGVLHRDLKPENILVLEDESQPVKVLDFGVAKVVAADRSSQETATRTLTGAGAIVGTPAYMAPEQLRGEPVDARTDVFSLGVIGYEMLTGDLPFGRSSLWDIGRQQLEGMKPLKSPTGPVHPRVEQAIARALRVDPAERPASAADFAALLAATPQM